MMKRFLLFLLLVLPLLSQAQELKHKAYLGLRTAALPDSLAVTYGLENSVEVTAIAPNATAAALQLQAHDILLTFNKQPVTSPAQLNQLAKNLYPGDKVALAILRDGKKKKLAGKAVARPLEKAKKAEVIYSQVPFREGQLRSIIHKPKAAGKHPAILFIPGYNCLSIEDYNRLSYGQLINGWSELGYVVMRVEKPGMGDSQNTPDCMDIDLYTETEAFAQGLEELQKLPYVDKDNIFIFGHSMGGIIAPLLTQKYNLKGVMVYGSPYRPWFEFAMDMFRFQGPVSGTDYVENEGTMNQLHHVLYRFFVLRQHPDTIAAADPKYKKILQEQFQHTGGDTFWSRNYRYWQQIDELNLTKAWAQTDENVLSIWGENDFEVVNAEDHKRIAEIVNHYHPGHATFLPMPKTNHMFIKVPGMAEGVQQMAKRDATYNQEHFNQNMITETNAWMQQVMRQTP